MGATSIDPDGRHEATSGTDPWDVDGGGGVDPWDCDGGTGLGPFDNFIDPLPGRIGR